MTKTRTTYEIMPLQRMTIKRVRQNKCSRKTGGIVQSQRRKTVFCHETMHRFRTSAGKKLSGQPASPG